MTTVNVQIHTELRPVSAPGVTNRATLKAGGSTIATVTGTGQQLVLSAGPGEYVLEVERLGGNGQPVAPAHSEVVTVEPYTELVPVGVTLTFAP